MIGDLTIAKYRFMLRVMDPIELLPYAGSAFRGGFGHAFRQAVCVTRLPVCEGCYLLDRCPYPYVFETPRPSKSSVIPKAKTVPHPFVLEPPLRVRSIAPGEELALHLILIGRGIEYFPYFLFAMEELGRRGLGRDRGRYQVEAVYGIGIREETPVYSGRFRRILGPGFPLTLADVLSGEGKTVEQIEIQFLTPTRILTNGRLTAQLDFPVLINALRRRIELLAAFHGGGPEKDDGSGLMEAAARVQTASAHLRWWDWRRFSGRQQTWMKLGGVVGTMRYRGELAPFLPYLKAGELLHVGSGTSFGLGQMRLLEPEAEDEGTFCQQLCDQAPSR